MDQPRIAAFAGSLRTESLNRKLLALAVHDAEKAGARVEVLDLKVLALPVYDGDVEAAGAPEAARRLRESLERAHGLLIATPEYNHSIPGGLKNAIDWASRPPDAPNPFKDKPALLLGATPGMGATVHAQSHLREVLRTLGVWAIPGSVAIARAGGAFDERNELRDQATRARLARLVALLVQLARQGLLGPATTR